MSQGQVTMNLFVGRKISLEALKAGYFRVPGWNGYPETSSHEDLDESGLKDGARSLGKEIIGFIPAAGDHGLWPWGNAPSRDRNVAPHGR